MLSIYQKSQLRKHAACILSLCLCLAGCSAEPDKMSTKATQQFSNQVEVVPKPQIRQATNNDTSTPGSSTSSGRELSTCQNEMLALSKVNPRLYTQKKTAFEELLSSASIYTNVRNTIGDQTRDTMDALYRYKTQKLCSDIAQALLQSLVNRGENIK